MRKNCLKSAKLKKLTNISNVKFPENNVFVGYPAYLDNLLFLHFWTTCYLTDSSYDSNLEYPFLEGYFHRRSRAGQSLCHI